MEIPTLEIIKTHPRILQKFVRLKEGKKISLSACYHCVALMWGFKSWEEMRNQYTITNNQQGSNAL